MNTNEVLSSFASVLTTEVALLSDRLTNFTGWLVGRTAAEHELVKNGTPATHIGSNLSNLTLDITRTAAELAQTKRILADLEKMMADASASTATEATGPGEGETPGEAAKTGEGETAEAAAPSVASSGEIG